MIITMAHHFGNTIAAISDDAAVAEVFQQTLDVEPLMDPKIAQDVNKPTLQPARLSYFIWS